MKRQYFLVVVQIDRRIAARSIDERLASPAVVEVVQLAADPRAAVAEEKGA